ncbi:Lanthionine synthetase C-like protein [Promicromonospora umidemergens]|uniref:Lanthionine synthetase-like protein n=2 Tax=Promicromonospora TaxID=43676 RepID=A0ABP8Y2N4_9MICO|nr:lanthionine synthetase C family protein [Promicromonospora umidemergens]MCP2286812.1 Lanthionine synthetase C-like protein [Promicromonospora umidemergens]
MSAPILNQTTAHTSPGVSSQSLAEDSAGLVLLSIEHAMTGAATWDQARAGLRALATTPVDAAQHTGLFYGAPALTFILHTAQADGRPRGQATLSRLDDLVSRIVRARLDAAAHRSASDAAPEFAEYDLFHGLTGLGALLLLRRPSSDVLADVLHYVVDLAQPRIRDDIMLPGWWVDHDPDPSAPTPGGHANLGMAHGAAALLALLGTAARRGIIVDGQLDAIAALLNWFDQWRQNGPRGTWWPQWLTRDELRTGRPTDSHPPRVSWCYGAPGIARAIQIGAIATGDHTRRATAEAAIASALTSEQIERLTDPGLCHGIAGLHQTAYRAALDAIDTTIADRLTAVAPYLARSATIDGADSPGEGGGDRSFLTGRSGVDLAASTLHHHRPPTSGWDACLLIS